MTKNKKILLGSMGVIAAIAAPAVAISCGSESSVSSDIFFVTDGGNIKDKSFNEQAYNALTKIIGSENGAKSWLHSSSKTAAAQIKQGYKAASIKDGVEYIIAPGFHHETALKTYFTENAKDPKDELKFIGLDFNNKIFEGENAKYNANVAGIQYAMNESGFLAGILASRYLIEIAKDATPTVATWGGGNFPGVTDFMTGFAKGVEYYNTTIRLSDATTPKVKFVVPATATELTDKGFNQGGGKVIAKYYLDNGADILLPVAGPQTSDAIEQINGSSTEIKNRVKIIGVDTNQAKSYPNDANLFLSSIEKNLTDAILKVYKKILSDAGKSLETLNDVKVDSDIKGLGQTTIGTLKNGLTKISAPSDNLKGADQKAIQDLYKEVISNKTYLAAAAQPDNNAGQWLGKSGDATWFAFLKSVGQSK